MKRSLWLILVACQACGQGSNVLPQLAPPYAELPPTFWVQHGVVVLVLALMVILAVALIVWIKIQPEPVVITPPEVQAREALEALRPRTEDGAVLSQISQILRRYFSSAFDLPPAELTTTEFCLMLSRAEKVGGELSATVADFLRQCDERKFSTAPSDLPFGATVRALELVAQGEARRAQLRQLAAAQAPATTTRT